MTSKRSGTRCQVRRRAGFERGISVACVTARRQRRRRHRRVACAGWAVEAVADHAAHTGMPVAAGPRMSRSRSRFPARLIRYVSRAAPMAITSPSCVGTAAAPWSVAAPANPIRLSTGQVGPHQGRDRVARRGEHDSLQLRHEHRAPLVLIAAVRPCAAHVLPPSAPGRARRLAHPQRGVDEQPLCRHGREHAFGPRPRSSVLDNVVSLVAERRLAVKRVAAATSRLPWSLDSHPARRPKPWGLLRTSSRPVTE